MTAEKFYLKYNGFSSMDDFEEFDDPFDIMRMMVGFARYHVEQAIEKIVDDNPGNMNKGDIEYLLKSYPLENIK